MKQNLFFSNFKFSKKNLTKKLLLAGLLASTTALHSQIVYVDIPDATPTFIDFNSDGNPEFNVGYAGVSIDYYNYGQANNIHALDAIHWDVPAGVNFNFPINATNNWDGMGDASLDGWGQGNATLPVNTDKYLAVRFNLTNLGANVYYGWIRISIDAAGTVTYKDYAYNSTPNTQILAGDKGALYTQEVQLSKLKLYPNPVKENLFISDNAKVASYKILTFAGQMIQTGEVHNNKIDFSQLPKGNYFIELLDAKKNKVSSQKIIKE